MKALLIGALVLPTLVAGAGLLAGSADGEVSRNARPEDAVTAAGPTMERVAEASVVSGDAPAQYPMQYRGGSFRGAGSEGDVPHSFYFSRAAYSGGSGFRRSGWATDYPEADIWITNVLRRLTGVDVSPYDNVVRLDDPELRRFPFIYAVEVGSMGLSPAEVQGLREYLLAGGFLMVDDFWGSWEWANFEWEIRQVLPEYEIVEVPLDHEIFRSYYAIDEIVQVPNIGNGMAVGMGYPGARTSEGDGIIPRFLGIMDEKDRLMVVINWNTDLGDAWEHAEDSRYPLMYSTYAYQMAANFIIYAMTH